jgi:hypothetical protein
VESQTAGSASHQRTMNAELRRPTTRKTATVDKAKNL